MYCNNNNNCLFWIVSIILFNFVIQQQQIVLALNLKSSVTSSSGSSSSNTKSLLPQAAEHNKKALRIALLVEPSPLTYVCGYTNRFKALLQHLHDSNKDDIVEVITCEKVVNKNDRPNQYLNYPIHYTSGIRLPLYPLMTVYPGFDFNMTICKNLYKFKPDLIHVTSPGLLIFSGIFWSRLFNIPLIISYHTHLPMYARTYIKPKLFGIIAEWFIWTLIHIFHSFADLNVVSSPQVQEEFQQHGVPRCQVWQKGIDTERFHPKHYNTAMRNRMLGDGEYDKNDKENNNDNDTFLIAYIGRLATEKRLYDLRAVVDKMQLNDQHSTGKKTKLCFVGTGPQEKELKSLFPDCVFTGQLHGNELCQAFASADVFCMPSDSETLGFVVLESMASGVPVIGVKAGGVQDLIHDGITGYLVEPGNTDEFVNRLIQLKNNNTLRTEMSKNARKEMEQWSWIKSMQKLRQEQYVEAKINFYNRFEQQIWNFVKKLFGRRRRRTSHQSLSSSKV